MPSDIDEVLADPDFHSQPLGWKLKTLRANYPEFSALAPSEQGRLIAKTQMDVNGTNSALDNKSEDPGFFSTLWDGVSSIPGAVRRVASAALNSGQVGDQARSELLNGMGAAQHNQFQQGRDAFARGDTVEGVGRTAAGALPVFGPAAAEIGENIGAGHYGQATANAILLGGPEAWGKFGPKTVKIPDISPRDITNPVERSALDFAKNKGVPVSMGQDTGQRGMQRVEQGLTNLPGSAYRAEDFYRKQQDALARTGSDLAGSPSMGYGTATPSVNGYGAGVAVTNALQARVNALRSYADKLYDSTRKTTARNLRDLPTGDVNYIPNPQSALDPTASPTMPVPVTAPMESPVALDAVRAQLKPIYDEFSAKLTTSQKEHMPSFAALQDIMGNASTYMPAMEFDKFLGALKSISRNGDSPILTSPSQRMARQIIGAGERQFQQAIANAGPNVAGKLDRARAAVKEYHDTADFLQSIQNSREEPGVLYNNLTTGGTLPASGDRVRNVLGYLNQVAPIATKTVGRTFLEGMVEKATKEGGFSRSPGVSADWQKMGPETKQLLFGPQLTSDLDNFFLAAKRLTAPLNASGSAHMLAAMGGLGAAGEMVRALVTGNPVEAVALGSGAFVAPNIAARVLFRPGGARLMRQAIQVPVNSPIFNRTMATLNAMAVDEAAVHGYHEHRAANFVGPPTPTAPPLQNPPPAQSQGPGRTENTRVNPYRQ